MSDYDGGNGGNGSGDKTADPLHHSSSIPVSTRVKSLLLRPPSPATTNASGGNSVAKSRLRVGVGGVFGRPEGPPPIASIVKAAPCPCTAMASIPTSVAENGKNSSRSTRQVAGSNSSGDLLQNNLSKVSSRPNSGSPTALVKAKISNNNNNISLSKSKSVPSSPATGANPDNSGTSGAVGENFPSPHRTRSTLPAPSITRKDSDQDKAAVSPSKPSNLSKYSKLSSISSNNSNASIGTQIPSPLAFDDNRNIEHKMVNSPSRLDGSDKSDNFGNDTNSKNGEYYRSLNATTKDATDSNFVPSYTRDSIGTVDSDTDTSSTLSFSCMSAKSSDTNCVSAAFVDLSSGRYSHETQVSHTSVIKQCIDRFRNKDLSSSIPISKEDFWWLNKNNNSNNYKSNDNNSNDSNNNNNNNNNNDDDDDDGCSDMKAATNMNRYEKGSIDLLSSNNKRNFTSSGTNTDNIEVGSDDLKAALKPQTTANNNFANGLEKETDRDRGGGTSKAREEIGDRNRSLLGSKYGSNDASPHILLHGGKNHGNNDSSTNASIRPYNNDRLEEDSKNGSSGRESNKASKTDDIFSNYEDDADNLLQKCENLLKEYKFEYSASGRSRGVPSTFKPGRNVISDNNNNNSNNSNSPGAKSGKLSGAHTVHVTAAAAISNEEVNVREVNNSDELNDIFEMLGSNRNGQQGGEHNRLLRKGASAYGGAKQMKSVLSSLDSFASIDMLERLKGEPGMNDEDEDLGDLLDDRDDFETVGSEDGNDDDGNDEDYDGCGDRDGERSEDLGIDQNSDYISDDNFSPFSSKSNLTHDSFDSSKEDNNITSLVDGFLNHDNEKGMPIISRSSGDVSLRKSATSLLTSAVRTSPIPGTDNGSRRTDKNGISNKNNNVDEAVGGSFTAIYPRLSVNESGEFARVTTDSPSSSLSPRSILKQNSENKFTSSNSNSIKGAGGASVRVSFENFSLVLSSADDEERSKSGLYHDSSLLEYFISPDSSVDLRGGFMASVGSNSGSDDDGMPADKENRSRSQNMSVKSISNSNTDNNIDRANHASDQRPQIIKSIGAPLQLASVEASNLSKKNNAGSKQEALTITWDEVRDYMTDPVVHRLYNHLLKSVNKL